MADSAAAKSTTPAKTPKKAKTPKPKAVVKPAHPSYKSMIMAAVKALKEKSGSSRQAILKYIIANYKVGDEKKAGNRLRIALRKLADSGDLKSVKGAGASGSFRLAKDDDAAAKKKPAAKKAKKPAAAKKAAAPKPTAAAKKATPKKAAKKPASADAAKKSAKKPVAKKSKSPKKPAAKKVAKKPAAKNQSKSNSLTESDIFLGLGLSYFVEWLGLLICVKKVLCFFN